MSVDRIWLIVVSVVLAGVIMFASFNHLYLVGKIQEQQNLFMALQVQSNEQKLSFQTELKEQRLTMQAQIDKFRDQLDEMNRRLAAMEVKYEFCMEMVRKQQRGQ